MHRLLVFCVSVLAIAAYESAAQQWVASIPNRACYSVTVNPLNRNVVYAGNVARRIFRSNDGGTSWEDLIIGSGGASGPSLITTLVVHPRDTAVVFAGGVALTTGLDRSTDGGQTWTNVLNDPEGVQFVVASSACITVNSSFPDSMYVMRSKPANLYRSINAGATWDLVGAIDSLPSQGRIRALTMAPDSTNVLLAGGRSAYIKRSTDAGKTWTTATNILALGDAEICNFAWSPTTPGKVYAVALIQNTSSGGLQESTDWGLTWNTPRFKDTSLYALAVQGTRNGDEIFVGGNLLEQYDFATKGDSIIYRTVNSGENWQSLDSVDWVENESGSIVANVYGFAFTGGPQSTEVLMATECGLYRSTHVTEVADDNKVQPTQPPTLTVTDNVLDVHDWQGAQGAFRVQISTLAGVCVANLACSPGEQRVILPHVAVGCYMLRLVTETETATSMLILGQ